MTSHFNIGDRVRCIEPKSTVSASFDLEDTVYTVSSYGPADAIVLAEKDQGTSYTQDRFELAKSENLLEVATDEEITAIIRRCAEELQKRHEQAATKSFLKHAKWLQKRIKQYETSKE